MSEKELNAFEALHMGIADQVVPCNKQEEAAIQAAHGLTKKSIGSLVGIKRLLN